MQPNTAEFPSHTVDRLAKELLKYTGLEGAGDRLRRLDGIPGVVAALTERLDRLARHVHHGADPTTASIETAAAKIDAKDAADLAEALTTIAGLRDQLEYERRHAKHATEALSRADAIINAAAPMLEAIERWSIESAKHGPLLSYEVALANAVTRWHARPARIEVDPDDPARITLGAVIAQRDAARAEIVKLNDARAKLAAVLIDHGVILPDGSNGADVDTYAISHIKVLTQAVDGFRTQMLAAQRAGVATKLTTLRGVLSEITALAARHMGDEIDRVLSADAPKG